MKQQVNKKPKSIDAHLNNLQKAFEDLSKNPSADASKKILEESKKSFQEVKKIFSNSSSRPSLIGNAENTIQETLSDIKNTLVTYIGNDNIKTVADSSKKMVNESEKLIKDHPISAILTAFVIGVILGRR